MKNRVMSTRLRGDKEVRRTILKGTFREIRGSLSRYISLVIIAAIGVAFFTGLTAVAPDMEMSGGEYFARTNFMDFRILSTAGITSDDLSALRNVDDVSGVQGTYSFDVLEAFGADGTAVAHLISLPEGEETPINEPVLIAGRLPERSGECAVDVQNINKAPSVGDTVRISSGDGTSLSDKIGVTEFKVVGIVETPAYLSHDRGISNLGNGKVNNLLFVPAGDFTMEVYTEAWIKMRNDGEGDFGEAYAKRTDRLNSLLEDLSSSREEIRYEAITKDANAKLEEKTEEYKEAERTANEKLSEALATLSDAEKKIKDARADLLSRRNEAEEQFRTAQERIDAASGELEEASAEYQQNAANYEAAKESAASGFADAENAIALLSDKIRDLTAQREALANQLSEGTSAGTLTADRIAQINSSIAALDTSTAALNAQKTAAESDLASKKQQLADAGAALDTANATLAEKAVELKDAQSALDAKISAANAGFREARVEIDENERALTDGYAAYGRQKLEVAEQLSDAWQQILDARKEIGAIERPAWHILDRDMNAGYADYKGSIDRTNGIASILPTVFFAIAALVCLSAMTRMVDEERSQIGTLKALGYKGTEIAFKYIFYAASASILGSLLGWALGFTIIPSVIFHAYNALYSVPHYTIAFHPELALEAAGVAVFVTTIATVLTCLKELRAVPSALMRREGPKPGKRIFLEYIPPLWNRFPFSRKVTARNLFRYKKRFWMTVLGVASCCAMLVAGFGLKDSIATEVPQKQFGEILRYDLSFSLDEDLSPDDRATAKNAIRDTDGVSSFTEVRSKTVTIDGKDASLTATFLVPSDETDFGSYFGLRDAYSGKGITLPSDGVVLTEKMSELLHAGVGDSVTVSDGEVATHTFRVEAIAENYLSHYIIVSPSSYRAAFGKAPGMNQVLANLDSGADEKSVVRSILSIDGVTSARLMSDMRGDFQNIIKSINAIIWVIILSGALLAFVVLYTLTSINIAERFREIATIKVLGFYDREVSGYITRESYWLTLFGTVLGMFGGVLLHGYVLGTAEVDAVMYVQTILPQSYLFAAALSFLFTVFINRMMMRSLRRIDMVEALKGNE